MQSYLVIGRGEGVQKKVDELVKKLDCQPMPFPLAKIADVRELSKFSRLALSEKTAVVIENFGFATEEAQNAFLKALEEPQKNLYYILATQNLENVLPTVLSRCQIIEISNSQFPVSKEISEQTETFIKSTVGEKFKITSRITKRDEALEFVEELILGGSKNLVEDPQYADFLSQAIKTLANLKANGNIQLQLTNFVVSLETFNSIA